MSCPHGYGERGWLRKCKFEPRYDTDAPDLGALTHHSFNMTNETIEQFRKKTYVRDVCVTCGKAIEREK